LSGVQPDAWATLCQHGLPVEQAVLGACIVYPEAIDFASEIATPEDFSEPAHRVLFEAMSNARKDGRRLDAGLLKTALGDRIKVDLGGVTLGDYIGRLVVNAPIAMAVREHLRSLRDFADYRRLYQASELLRERASRGVPAGLPKDIAIDVIQALDGVVSANQPPHLKSISIGDAAAAVLDGVRRAHKGELKEPRPAYGVPELDDITGGLHRGHLTIVAARPSMGKSAFAVSVALNAAMSGHRVGFFSLEMSAEELAGRCISSLSYNPRDPIPYIDIQLGRVAPCDDMRLADAYERMSSLPLLIDGQPGLSPAQISTRARSLSQKIARDGGRLGLIIVDHIGKVRPSDRYAGNRTTELGEITGALKDMARELACPVVALCQLNRQTEQRENKRPTLGDLRESGRIEEDADNVLLLYREAYYQERTKQAGEDRDDREARIAPVRNEFEIIVAKQRQGATGVVEAWCDMPCNVIQGKG
jgi:replicative DNA helicase